MSMLKSLPVEWEQVGKKHTPLQRKGDFSDLIVFANIRNPFDRIVSMYEYRRQATQETRFKNIDFQDFFYNHYLGKDLMPYNPIHYFLFVDNELPENVIPIRLEDIDIWGDIISTYFQRKIRVPHINFTEHGNPERYFNGKMKTLVRSKEWWAVEQYTK